MFLLRLGNQTAVCFTFHKFFILHAIFCAACIDFYTAPVNGHLRTWHTGRPELLSDSIL